MPIVRSPWRQSLTSRHHERVEDPPEGYVQPFLVYLLEYTDSREPLGWAGQVGGFSSLAEAEKLRDRLNAEGGWGEVFINAVPIHARIEDYQHDR